MVFRLVPQGQGVAPGFSEINRQIPGNHGEIIFVDRFIIRRNFLFRSLMTQKAKGPQNLGFEEKKHGGSTQEIRYRPGTGRRVEISPDDPAANGQSGHVVTHKKVDDHQFRFQGQTPVFQPRCLVTAVPTRDPYPDHFSGCSGLVQSGFQDPQKIIGNRHDAVYERISQGQNTKNALGGSWGMVSIPESHGIDVGVVVFRDITGIDRAQSVPAYRIAQPTGTGGIWQQGENDPGATFPDNQGDHDPSDSQEKFFAQRIQMTRPFQSGGHL